MNPTVTNMLILTCLLFLSAAIHGPLWILPNRPFEKTNPILTFSLHLKYLIRKHLQAFIKTSLRSAPKTNPISAPRNEPTRTSDHPPATGLTFSEMFRVRIQDADTPARRPIGCVPGV